MTNFNYEFNTLLPVRARNAILNIYHNIKHKESLTSWLDIALNITEAEFLRHPNAGRKSLNDLRGVLLSKGLVLGIGQLSNNYLKEKIDTIMFIKFLDNVRGTGRVGNTEVIIKKEDIKLILIDPTLYISVAAKNMIGIMHKVGFKEHTQELLENEIERIRILLRDDFLVLPYLADGKIITIMVPYWDLQEITYNIRGEDEYIEVITNSTTYRIHPDDLLVGEGDETLREVYDNICEQLI